MANFRDFIHNEQPDDDGFDKLFNEYQEFLNSGDDVTPEPIKEEPQIVRGPQGPKGEKGDKGEPGERGLRGLRGITGPKGERGDRGEKGIQGDKGDKGERGEKGETGKIGSRGEKGDRGEAGSQGAPGPQGLRGEKGAAGDRGPQGERGEKGEQGDQGERGERGQQGDQGERGEVGPQGVAGSKGEKGDKGDRGDDGSQGPQGVAGPKGERGDKGDRGEKGEQGEKGERGEQGERGATGDSGILKAIYPLRYDNKSKIISIDPSKLGTTVLGNPGGGLDTAFKTVSVSGQPSLASVQYDAENLNFVAGSGISLATDPSTNSVTITNLGGVGGGGGTGPTGAQGTTGYGYTAASISGDNYLYVSILYPNGSSSSPIQLGYVRGNTGATGPVGDYVRKFNGLTGDVTGITQAAGTVNGVIQYRDFGVGATGLSSSTRLVWGGSGLTVQGYIAITGPSSTSYLQFPDGTTQTTAYPPSVVQSLQFLVDGLSSQVASLTAQLSAARQGDLNGDGIVNGADLGLLLANWGPINSFAPPGTVVDDNLYPPVKTMNEVRSLVVYNRGDRAYNRISADDFLSDTVHSFNGVTGDITITGYKFTQGATAPTGASAGDRWLNTNTGLYYTAFLNTSSTIWIQV